MAGLGTGLEAGLLGWFRGQAFAAAPAGLWLALWNGDPEAGGSEVTATVRPAGRAAVTLAAPSGGATSNAAAVDFGTAAGTTSVSHVALTDAASGGTLLASGALGGGAQAVAAGAQVMVAAGALSLAVS